MKNVKDVQCPNCSAPIKFDAKLGKMKCDYCNSIIRAEDLKNMNLESDESESVAYVMYNCPDCGAEIIADENTSATFCLYCGNTAILKQKLVGKFKPDFIIPFKTTKEDAMESFKSLKKGRPFVPKSFISTNNIEKITGLYIPFWLFDIQTDGKIECQATRVKTWASGNKQYTKTDYYTLMRDGSMHFSKIPVDGSKKFADDIMNSIEPFSYSDLKEFNPAYLSGYLAEKYDITSEELKNIVEERSIETTKDVFMNDMQGYMTIVPTEKNIKVIESTVKYALLPVWMVNVKYKDKYYLFAMNGQTGKFIGNIPLDVKKVIVWGFSIFVVSFMIIVVISYLMYLIGGSIT